MPKVKAAGDDNPHHTEILMDPVIIAAVITTTGLVSVAIINSVVLILINHVSANVQKIETATNSMKDQLVDLATAKGKAEGKVEVLSEIKT